MPTRRRIAGGGLCWSAERLRDLEHWAREAEEGAGGASSEEERWLAQLVAPGSSLGGSRPKANYLNGDDLWIAKFPSREDRHDVGAWEYLISRLASEAELERIGSAFASA